MTSQRTLLYPCRNLWPLKTWLWSPTLLTRMIWQSVNSAGSVNENAITKASFPVSPRSSGTLTVLQNIPKSEFQKCYQQWLKRWTYCINRKGAILKGLTTIYEVQCIFCYRLSRRTSWYAIVCLHVTVSAFFRPILPKLKWLGNIS